MTFYGKIPVDPASKAHECGRRFGAGRPAGQKKQKIFVALLVFFDTFARPCLSWEFAFPT
jgi:hypothetical protein